MSRKRYESKNAAVRQLVFDALGAAAFENGYHVWSMSARDQALDLKTYCAGLEEVSIPLIAQYVGVWRTRNPHPHPVKMEMFAEEDEPKVEKFGPNDDVPFLSTQEQLAPLRFDTHNTLSIRKRKSEVLNPLDEFVFQYEPNGLEEESQFRVMFSKAVEWARRQDQRMIPLTIYQLGALARECAIASCAADVPWTDLHTSDQGQMDKRALNIQKVLEGDTAVRGQTKVLRKAIFGL